jgi:hypothetical protein
VHVLSPRIPPTSRPRPPPRIPPAAFLQRRTNQRPRPPINPTPHPRPSFNGASRPRPHPPRDLPSMSYLARACLPESALRSYKVRDPAHGSDEDRPRPLLRPCAEVDEQAISSGRVRRWMSRQMAPPMDSPNRKQGEGPT